MGKERIMNNHYVQVLTYENDEVIKELGPFSERRAEKVEEGVRRNMSMDYYSRIIEKD